MTMPCLTLETFLKHRQKQISLDKFLVKQRSSQSQAESSGTKRKKRERKETPRKTVVSCSYKRGLTLQKKKKFSLLLPHHFPSKPSTFLRTGTIK